MNCPECGSERIKDNRHNEHICIDCGECFYFSPPEDSIDFYTPGENIKKYGARLV